MIRAYVLIQSVKQEAKKTVEAVSKIDGVIMADVLWGIHDAIAVVEARDLNDLDVIVCHNIKAVPTVHTTATMIAKDLSIPDRAN